MKGHQYQLFRLIHSVRMKMTMEAIKVLATNKIILIEILNATLALRVRTIAIAIEILMLIITVRAAITTGVLTSRMKAKITVRPYVQGERQDRR